MSNCPADMSGIHAIDAEGHCMNCDGGPFHTASGTELTVPAIFAAARMIEESGCYICQPANPNAAEEGCGDCDRQHWDAEIARLKREEPESDPDCYCGLRCYIGRGCHVTVFAPTDEDYRQAGVPPLNPDAL